MEVAMTTVEWKASWIEVVVEAGFSHATATDTFQAMYGRDGPNLAKDAKEEAALMLGKLEMQN
jgi:hypothetical protein